MFLSSEEHLRPDRSRARLCSDQAEEPLNRDHALGRLHSSHALAIGVRHDEDHTGLVLKRRPCPAGYVLFVH